MRGCRGTGTEEVDSRGPGADEGMQRPRYKWRDSRGPGTDGWTAEAQVQKEIAEAQCKEGEKQRPRYR
jgi:hypothetical protein